MPKNVRERLRALMALCAIAVMLAGGAPYAAASVDDVQVASAPLSTKASAMNGMVRVYLSSLGNPSRLDLTVVGNYSISTTGEFISSGSSLTVGFSSSTGAITLTHNGVKTNMGTSFSLRRHSASGTNGIKISQARESNNPYPGDLTFKAISSGSGYTLYTIANIYIENYLYGVLPYEMGNSTNIEALKAQAVAARTYTVRMMQNRASGLYDVKDTTSDQVYRGTPSGNANCVAAVDATKGIVLMYGSSYITTYYSASNGGQTEIDRSGGAYAYMKVKDDPFDYANPSSTVKKKTVYADLTSSSNPSGLISLLKTKAVTKLQSMGYSATQGNTTLQTLKNVTAHTPKYASPSRLYTKMDFTFTAATKNSAGASATATVTVTCDIFDELESLLSMGIQSLDNELWSVSKSGSNFVLEARRYGHGMGMSQRGAMYMAKLGYTYDQILGFYYEGCKRVQHSFTNTILSADSSEEQVTVEPPADLEEEDASACKGTVKLVSAGSSLAIRSAKSTTASLIGTAGNGAIVDVLSSDGTWCFIRFGDLKGYVPANALSISGTPVGSEEAPTSIIGFATVTASDFVNLRAEGSMSAQVVSTAPSGAVLTVFSQSGSWARVQYNATVAYANTGYLSAVTSTYPSNAVSSGSATATVGTSDGSGSVNLRASASTGAQVLAQIPSGTQVTVSSDDGSWCVVSYQGMTGYVMSAYISYTGDSLEPGAGGEQDGTGGTGDESGDQADGSGTQDGTQTPAVRTAIVTTEYGSLNMRAQASAGSQILTTIPRGALVEVTQEGATWCGVRYNGISGYSMTCFLTFTDGGSATPSVPEGGTTAVVTTQSGSLNLREQARSGSAILTRIPQYATIAVHERGAEWCHVTYNGVTGYVMTVFLTFQDEPMPDLPDDSEQGAETGDEPDANDPNEPIVTPEPGGDNALYAVVTTVSGSLNLRRDALPGSPVLARIPKGTTIRIDEKLSAWSRTSYGGQTGYVMNTYLTFHQGKPEISAGTTAVVTTASGSLNLRTEPSLSGGVIARIPQYATINVQQRGDSWCYVVYNDTIGYVMTSYLTFDGDSVQPPSDGASEPDSGDNSTNTGSDGAGGTMTAYVQTESGSLNLREQPGSAYRVLRTIPRGTAVTVLSYGDPWCQVIHGGVEGYVMTSFLRFDTPPSLPQEPETDEGQDGTDAPETDDETSQPNTPTPAPPQDMPDESTAVTAWVNTVSGGLNLRYSPDGSSQIILTIPRLAAVKLLVEGNEWSYVSYNGKYGYVMTSYLTTTQPSADSGGGQAGGSSSGGQQSQDGMANSGGVILDITLQVPTSATYAVAAPQNGDVLSLWTMCAETGEPLASVPSGERVEVILSGRTWCLVQYGTVQGYCQTAYLEVQP